MPPSSAPLILLAAGGTGGHVFPAEALARELLGRGFRVALVTDQRGDQFSDDLHIPVYRVHASALGKGWVKKIKSVILMGYGVAQALRVLSKLDPAAIVGFGGYPSIPALYAASRHNIPIILHEQNAVLGRANKAMLSRARLIATSFPHVVGLHATHTPQIVMTGNPVRPSFATLRGTPYTPPADSSPIRLLVLGGSLGAHILSDVVPKAIALLPSALRHRLVVTQQCRAADLDSTRAAYAGIGIETDLAPFFTDVPDRLGRTHLIICRSGGSTIAEITAVGRPAILIPYPHGHAQEQLANAEAVAEAGGAWLIPEQAFTPEALAVRLEALLTLPSSLSKAANAARAWGTISAADNLADCVEAVIDYDKPTTSPKWMENPDQTGQEASLALATSEKNTHPPSFFS